MTLRKKLSAVFAAIFAPIALLFAGFAMLGTPAAADEPVVAVLTPVEAKDGEITYYCFDSPSSVFADAEGILVSGENGVTEVSADGVVGTKHPFPAQKAFRYPAGEDERIVALYNGSLAVYAGDVAVQTITEWGDINDFYVSDKVIYALSGSVLTRAPLSSAGADLSRAVNLSLTRGGVASPATHAVVLAGTVYVSVRSAGGSKQDVCAVTETGALSMVLTQSDSVLSMATDGAAIYVLTRNELIRYVTAESGGLLQKSAVDGSQFVSACAANGRVFALDTLNGLHKLHYELNSDATMLAAASARPGFFDMPSGTAAKNSKLYVADTVNGRVAVYGDDITYPARRFYLPAAVACDSAGTLYVAYEYNKVGIFSGGDLSPANELTVTHTSIGIIKQILVDSDKNLYILADNGLFVRGPAPDAAPAKISGTPYRAIALSVGKDGLYALGDGAVYSVKGNTPVRYCTVPNDAISIAVDLNGAVFSLTPQSIVRSTPTASAIFAMTCGGAPYTLGEASGHIMLCTVQNEFVDHGDLVVTDTYRHRVLKVDAKAALGATLVDTDYPDPDELVDPVTPGSFGEGLIRYAVRDADVYQAPMEASPIYSVKSGATVIVPKYALDDVKEYSLVFIEDGENHRAVQGYMYRDALSDVIPYDYKPSEQVTVFNAGTPIYKYPSRYSSPLTGYSATNKNTKFDMLGFIQAYTDINGYHWFRIALPDDSEGFVLSVNVSTLNYEPIFIRPDFNATIVKYKGNDTAPLYIKENGKYVKVAEAAVGTQVEVLGSFDSSEPYTKIKLLDPERGTLTCYTETGYIDYDGINVVLIVAIIVIIVTITLAAIIAARMMKAKRKRLVHEDENE